MDIVARVKEIAAPYLSDRGIELFDVVFRREAQGMVLRLIVDKPYGGIRLFECEEVNKYLSGRFDEESIIDEKFILEVSSPGLDRRLKTDNDFRRVIGSGLVIDTIEQVCGKRHLEGKLVGMDKDSVVIESGGISALIPRVKIACAKLKLDF